MEEIQTPWLVLFGAPILIGLLLWRFQRLKKTDPFAGLRDALQRVNRNFGLQLYYALPAEMYPGDQTLLGVLAVLEGKLHFETLDASREMDVDFARVTAYEFGTANARGFSGEGYRVVRLQVSGGVVEFGLPAWGEKNLAAALKAAAGK